MKILASVILLAATSASADPKVSLYYPGGTVLVHLDDDTGAIAKLVGTDKKGVVRCVTATDQIVATAGAADVDVTGCFVAITRAGKLVAPPAGKRWDFSHLIPFDDGGLRVDANATGDALELAIDGAAGNAIGLWVDCADTRGDLRCRQVHGMVGKFNWDVAFAVTKGGGVKLASW